MQVIPRIFNYAGEELRTVTINKEVWFVAKDVCSILGLKNPTKAVRRLDEDEKGLTTIQSPTGFQKMNIVNESGIYSLVFSSRKPEAHSFKRWVTHEVLPAIRSNGIYSIMPQSFGEALRLAAEQQEKIERDAEKVMLYELFIDGTNFQTVNEVAKVLGCGRNTLFKLLKQHKILMRNNTPYQKYINLGYFVVKERSIRMGGKIINIPQTYVTAKGIPFINKILQKAMLPTSAITSGYIIPPLKDF
jgi:anti-repressor protein